MTRQRLENGVTVWETGAVTLRTYPPFAGGAPGAMLEARPDGDDAGEYAVGERELQQLGMAALEAADELRALGAGR